MTAKDRKEGYNEAIDDILNKVMPTWRDTNFNGTMKSYYFLEDDIIKLKKEK